MSIVMTDIYVVKNIGGVSAVVASDNFTYLDENDFVRMCEIGAFPEKATKKISGVLSPKMKRGSFLKIADMVLPYHANIRDNIIDYYSMKSDDGTRLDTNNLKSEMLADTVFQNGDEIIDCSEVLSMIGVTVGDYNSLTLSTSGEIAVTKGYGFIAKSDDSVISLYKIDDGFVVFRDGKVVELDMIDEFVLGEVSVLSHNVVTIKGNPIFSIVGYVDLSEYDVIGNDSKLKKICKKLNIDPKLSVEKMRDKFFEEMNSIAEITSFPYKSMILVDEAYIKLVFGDGVLSTVRRINDNRAIGIMARRHGKAIVSGNPLFDESTLKGGAKWYLMTMKED